MSLIEYDYRLELWEAVRDNEEEARVYGKAFGSHKGITLRGERICVLRVPNLVYFEGDLIVDEEGKMYLLGNKHGY